MGGQTLACPRRVTSRNKECFFPESADIFSMPDKWEYPWFAAWDLAFHYMVLTRLDVDFAKEQLRLRKGGSMRLR